MKLTSRNNFFLLLILAIPLLSCNLNPGKGSAAAKPKELVLTLQSVTESSVQLSWNGVEGVKEYAIISSTKADGEFLPVALTGSTSISLKGLLPSKKYYFKVSDFKGRDEINETWILGLTSGAISATTEAATLQAPVISSQSVTEHAVTFSWGKVTGADRYYIYRTGREFEDFGSTGVFTTEYSKDGFEGGSTQRYKVVAYNAATGQTSEQSLEVVLKTDPASLPTPIFNPKPTSYKLGLDLTLAAGETLELYRFKTAGHSYYLPIGEISQASQERRFEVKPGESYHLKFRYFNMDQGKTSPFSELYTITIPQPELRAVPQNIKLADALYRNEANSDSYDTDVTISWEVVPEAELYYIYKIDNNDGEEEINFLGSTESTSFKERFSGTVTNGGSYVELKVRVVKSSTGEAGPFSAPFKVKLNK